MRKSQQDLFYPFAWLDRVIEFTFNPYLSPVKELSATEIADFEQQFATELNEVFGCLKAQVFCLGTDQEIKAVLKHYLHALKFLKQQAMENLAAYPADLPIHLAGENMVILLEEISRLIERRYSEHLHDLYPPQRPTDDFSNPESFKVLCHLSVDQLGIILKAADDTRLLVSRSLSLIFRSIVPFLSTEKIKNISWNSMRKSTYQPERADKEIAIAVLEKMIRKIREY